MERKEKSDADGDVWYAQRERGAGRLRMAFMWCIYVLFGNTALKIVIVLVAACIYLFSAPVRRNLRAFYAVGVALGLPFFLFSLKSPEVVGHPLQMQMDFNTPLAMIGALVGVRACVPTLNPVMAVAISTAAAAPTAALTTVIAARYDKDVSTATSLVSGTTLLSILTMPPIVGFALWLFG